MKTDKNGSYHMTKNKFPYRNQKCSYSINKKKCKSEGNWMLEWSDLEGDCIAYVCSEHVYEGRMLLINNGYEVKVDRIPIFKVKVLFT